MENVLLKCVKCKRCSQQFYICNSCWRGQVYCSDECRDAAQNQAHCISQKKYRQTKKGKEAHRQQEKNKRLRDSIKNVDDATSTPIVVRDSVLTNLLFVGSCCHFCGRKGQMTDHFPRRGYGGRYLTTDPPS